MNLQLCSPYKKCPFNCPMCIAATDDGEINNVPNLFGENRFEYYLKLGQALRGKKTVVITGDTEPTLFPNWISSVLNYMRNLEYQGKIELQTKNYHITSLVKEWSNHDLDLVAYSATCPDDLDKVFKMMNTEIISCKTRLVILLTDENVDYLYTTSIKNFAKFSQITFKVLQNPNCEEKTKVINNIKNFDDNKLKKIIDTLKEYTSCSVRVDENCMDSEGRYEIMRIDGNIYKTWF